MKWFRIRGKEHDDLEVLEAEILDLEDDELSPREAGFMQGYNVDEVDTIGDYREDEWE